MIEWSFNAGVYELQLGSPPCNEIGTGMLEKLEAFLDDIDVAPKDVSRWNGSEGPSNRNSLISLSLRPAPVTDQWLTDGPGLGDLSACTAGLALMEADSAKEESLAIAIALRAAVEEGKIAALITPDRTLGRRVAAARLAPARSSSAARCCLPQNW